MSHLMKRLVLWVLMLGLMAPVAVSAQGRCMTTYGSPACNTTDVAPVFAPTGWKTVALDHVTFEVTDYKKEAAFYIAVMGWTLRRDDGKQAVMDLVNWGTVIFKQAPSGQTSPAGANGTGRAVVTSFGFVIEPWNANTVESELRKRGLTGRRPRRQGIRELSRERSRRIRPADRKRQRARAPSEDAFNGEVV